MGQPRFDSTLAFVRDGYRFISNECARLGTDAFPTRIGLLRPLICMRGAEAARLFYDDRRFQRQGAAPIRLQKTLTGQGGVQGLDREQHRSRKALFMALMTPERLAELVRLTAAEWAAAIERWAGRPVVLYTESQEILCRAACQWSGVPLADAQARTKQFAALIEGAGAVGWRHWQGRIARRQLERWLAELIEQVRAGRLQPAAGTALRAMAEHRDGQDRELEPRIAAVEVINVIRPTVAISTFIAFAALALHEYPDAARRVREGDAAAAERFVQEVRRHYPFFPFVVARVRHDFEWRGLAFRKGCRVLLDLFGTDHDPALWQHPDAFDPERFRDWDGSAYGFIPHGGGDHFAHHRCAGEWLTIELMKVAVAFLARGMEYRVPRQDLRYSARRVPTRPQDGFVMADVRATATADAVVRWLVGSPRLRPGLSASAAVSIPAEATEIG